jgi:hypothetical protein
MKRAAIGEALSHLVYLARHGRLAMDEDEGLTQFQAS